ncbi:MAG TPA: hypothetical protein VMS17_10270, partial [Gemmataceae bacterium]|nr:hypothetical protein [Gemmataceae bacterium]
MSKHCEVCNCSYADDLKVCPHCAEVAEIGEADVVDLGSSTQMAAELAPEIVAQTPPIAPSAVGPDSAVDLGLPALPADPNGGGSRVGESDVSVIEWASLVEEGPALAEPAAASFDDPADADLLSQAPTSQISPTAPPAEPASEATISLPAGDDNEDALAADLDTVRTIFAGDASASFARRDPAQPAESAAASDDSALNQPGPAKGDDMLPEDEAVSLIKQQPIGTGSDSGIDLSAVEVVEEPGGRGRTPAGPIASDSDINLSAVEVVDSGLLEEPSEVQIVDSGIDLSGAEVVDVAPPGNPEEAAVRPISDSGIDLSPLDVSGSDSGPQAGIEKDSPGTSDSGVDRIAAEVESGMMQRATFDVGGDSDVSEGSDDAATALTAGQLPSGEEEVDLTETPAGAEAVESSSAVDLGGSSATFPAAPVEPSSGADEMEGTKPYESKERSIHDEADVSPSEVDLGARHKDGSSKDFFEESEALAEAPSAVDEVEESGGLSVGEEEAGVEEPAAVEEELGAVEEEEEAAATAAKPEKRRSTAGAWIGGLVLGGVVTAGALLALWFFKIEPPKEWRGDATASAPPPATPGTPKGLVVGGPTGSSVNKADLLRNGDLDLAATNGVESVDESKPDEMALRGQYRVRKSLMQQSLHGLNGGALKADDAMNSGIADLEKAKAQSEDALFWLGVANEATGKTDAAKAAYQAGLDRAKDAKSKQRFQDAINRLSTTTPSKPAGMGRAAPGLDPALLVLIVTGVSPAPAPPAPPSEPVAPDEAGSKFWEATRLAQEGKYDEAGKALAEAERRHTDRRFTVLGKAQNPSSDPTEEIFVRSCEELKAYWALRDQLSKSTLPITKGQEPAAGVAALMKEGETLKNVRETLGVKPDADAAAITAAAKDANKSGETIKAVADALGTKPEGVVDAAKGAAKAAANLDAALKAAKDAKDDAATKDDTIKAVADALAAKPEGVVEAAKGAAKTATDLGAALKAAKADAARKDDTIKAVADAVGAKPEGVVEAVKETLKSKDVQEAAKVLRALREERDALKLENNGLQSKMDGMTAKLNGLQMLAERRSPEKMAPIWLTLLGERK